MRLYKLITGDDDRGFLIDLKSVTAIQDVGSAKDYMFFNVFVKGMRIECIWTTLPHNLRDTDTLHEIHDDLVTAWKQYLDSTYKQI